MTKLKAKVTSALNETRMLILGAQILLGFQLNAVFQPRFTHLADHARWLDLAGLALMSVAVACLIAPAPFHQIVERGRDTTRLHAFATRMAASALLPFGLCIGIDVFVVAELLFGTTASIIAGAAFAGVAALFWYGLEVLQRYRQGGAALGIQEDIAVETHLSEKISMMMIEGRVILPGAQALLGFQFAAFLTNSFEQLPHTAQLVHFGCLASVALSVILLMSPAAYHRLVAYGEDRPDVYRFGSRMILASLAPLSAGLSGEFFVVASKIGYAGRPAIVATLVSFVLFIGFWYGYPLWVLARRPQGARRVVHAKER